MNKPERSIEPWLGAAKIARLWQEREVDMNKFIFTKKDY